MSASDRPETRYNFAVALALAEGVVEAAEAIASARESFEQSHDLTLRSYGLAGLDAASGDLESAIGQLKQVLNTDSRPRQWLNTDPAWTKARATSDFLSLLEAAADPPTSPDLSNDAAPPKRGNT
jgi:hypothetical protein